jgi:hypothetical protein
MLWSPLSLISLAPTASGWTQDLTIAHDARTKEFRLEFPDEFFDLFDTRKSELPSKSFRATVVDVRRFTILHTEIVLCGKRT